MRIAVTGASGQLGQLVIQQLLERTDAKNLVALVRSPEKSNHLKEKGIDIRAFDYSQAPEQLAKQLQDIDKLLLISSSEVGKRALQHEHVIDAARLAQVNLIVYTSILNADTSPLQLAEEHRATENYLKQIGIPHILLRNSWYNENYAMALPQAVEHGKLFGATHQGKISSASRADYAIAAAVVLTQDGHENKVYELAGDRSYTLDDVAKWTSELTGKLISYQDLSEQHFKTVLVQAGLPEDFAGILANSDESVSKDGLYSTRQDLHHLIGRETTPMQETIKEFLSKA